MFKHVRQFVDRIIKSIYSNKQLNETVRITETRLIVDNATNTSVVNVCLVSLIVLLLCTILYIYVFLIFVKIDDIERELEFVSRLLLKAT